MVRAWLLARSTSQGQTIMQTQRNYTQTLLGFYMVPIWSQYFCEWLHHAFADDGFGNLVNIPSKSFPVYAIEQVYGQE